MGIRGPNPKSAEVRVLEGQRAHRPLPPPAPKYAVGVPEKPKGMTLAARHIWDGYVGQLGGTLRLVDGYALRRLCEDVALLEELQTGFRKMANEMKREARADSERMKELEEAITTRKLAGEDAAALEAEQTELRGRRLSGGAMVSLAKTHDGRRITATISSLASRIARQELQFGLTPASAGRVEGFGPGAAMPPGAMDSIEAALCG